MIFFISGLFIFLSFLFLKNIKQFFVNYEKELVCNNERSDVNEIIESKNLEDNVSTNNEINQSQNIGSEVNLPHINGEMMENKNQEGSISANGEINQSRNGGNEAKMSAKDISSYDFSSWNASVPLELRVINKNNPISEDCVPQVEDFGNKKVNKIISEPLKNMINDAKKEGLHIFVLSGYRSIERQKDLFNNQVKSEKVKGLSNEKAEEKASEVVAKPGQSEHNEGISVDFNCVDCSFENTGEYCWLKKNAQNYGFIERYTGENENETGVIAESWHWRYVGIDFAKEIKKSGKTLERFIIENKILCN